MNSTLNQPLDQVLTPTRRRLLGPLLLVVGAVLCLSAAVYGYVEQTRQAPVVLVARPVRAGQQLSAADLAIAELAQFRDVRLAGIADPTTVIGRYAARDLAPNDLLQPSMVTSQPPTEPRFASGEQLQRGMVVLPFATQTIGPLEPTDAVNLGYLDPSGDPTRCRAPDAAGSPASAAPPAPGAAGERRAEPYACRVLTQLNVLDVDRAKGIAYLEVTPVQAHAMWAIQALGLSVWGERVGAESPAVPPLTRLDIHDLTPEMLWTPGASAAATTDPALSSLAPEPAGTLPAATDPAAPPEPTPAPVSPNVLERGP